VFQPMTNCTHEEGLDAGISPIRDGMTARGTSLHQQWQIVGFFRASIGLVCGQEPWYVSPIAEQTVLDVVDASSRRSALLYQALSRVQWLR
jgi:hypothetical protein